MVQRRNVILGVVGAAAGLTAAGCSSVSQGSPAGEPAAGTWQTPAAATTTPTAVAAPISLTVSPQTGAAKVSPTVPVTVAVEGGKLTAVTVVAGSKKIGGTVQADGSWRSTGTLAYGKTYTVTAAIQDSTGAQVEKTSTFTTLKPAHIAGITFQANGLNVLRTGATYGMGQPVIVAFGYAVKDRAAAEKAITVETSPRVEGKFFWVSKSIVHWRPAKYFKKGTTIKVSVDVFGVHLGNNVYGRADAQTHFTIGRSLLAVNDNTTHRTKVYIDGEMVRDMASSNGRGGYTKGADGQQIHFWTQAGPHVVLSKEKSHSMSSASYGLTDPKNPFFYAPEDVKLCTRISYSGEFLHAAPWNKQLGQANISHGCVNLSEADAQWVYDTFMVGDVVDVRHSPISLPVSDGLGDWTVPYDRYGA